MCRAIEEYIEKKCEEIIHARSVELALEMLSDKLFTLDLIAKYTELPLSEVESLAQTLPA